MPQDTIWLNGNDDNIIVYNNSKLPASALLQDILSAQKREGTFTFSYNPKNSSRSDSILSQIMIADNKRRHKNFNEEKAYYDKLTDKLEVAISFCFVFLLIWAYYKKKKKETDPEFNDADWVEIGTPSGEEAYRDYPKQPVNVPCLTYFGKDLRFTQEQVSSILILRFPFFNKLNPGEKRRFLNRHMKFMKAKVFNIYDKSGFKEMPVLISAAAIQLSFGLEEYMLPYFRNINIFPEEFLGVQPTIRFLEGNVSGKNINISWKHFLQGYAINDNGENVGLHEMAHAFYCQNFQCTDNTDNHFTSSFPTFSDCGTMALQQETQAGSRFYSDYALKNFQEFWAESVERFFERPAEMKQKYPEMYESLTRLLNQRPV